MQNRDFDIEAKNPKNKTPAT